ncbi:MAG: hypothetical protein AAF657_13740 [Acidobacteriota bacterium]
MSLTSVARVLWTVLVIASLLNGPAEAGIGEWTSNGPFGGEIQTLTVDPITPSTLYAITANGGLFKSTNSGASWSAANDGFPGTAFAQDLAIDPITPSTLYAATSLGVFRSTDRGASWSAVLDGLNTFTSVVAIDPVAPSTIYAGTLSKGLFKSTDSGASWSAINNGLPDSSTRALAIDPITPSTLYTATGPVLPGDDGGVFKSTDSGATWSAINNGLAGSALVLALAIDPITPSTLYTGTINDGVFKSTDSGATWSAISDGLLTSFHFGLAIDPITPSTLYAGTSRGVYKSTDSGATWSAINSGLNTLILVLAIDPITPSTLYAGTRGGVFKRPAGSFTWSAVNNRLTGFDIQALAIDPSMPSTLYAGTEAGVYKSSDSGVSWSAISDGLPDMTFVRVLAIDPITPSILYAGGPGSVYKSTDGGASWSAANNGLTGSAFALAIDPVTPSTLYAGTLLNGVFKSTDSGASWSAINDGLTNTRIRALGVDPVAPSTLYVGTTSAGGVFKSIDGGASWSANGLTGISVQALAIDSSTPNTLYAGTIPDGVFKSTDSGASWSTISVGLPNSTSAETLVIDPITPSTLYVGTTFRGVYESTDSGTSWSRMNNGLTNLQIRDLAIDPITANTLYAGTAGSVFEWTSSGPPCLPSSTNLCLNGSRFEAEVHWRDFTGSTGTGFVVPLGSADSGLFWFFSDANWEMLIKVLDGCDINDHFWVFAAATTDVEYTLRVTDTGTGAVTEYSNPLGRAAPAITDTSAFATCGEGGSRSLGNSTSRRKIHSASQAAPRPRLPINKVTAECTPDASSLCLNDGRFKVEVAWVDFGSNTGTGQVVPAVSNDSGLFWFFNSDNWEMLVKVLNGCEINDHFWVFAAATTDVEYTLRVTDTETGAVTEYSNPLGRAAPAITDTSAFPTCPEPRT